MLLTVKAASKFGFIAEEREGWVNWGKGLEHPEVVKGQTLEVDLSDKGYIKSFKLTGTAPSPQATPQAPQRQEYKNDPSLQDRISRGNACNAVFGSPLIAELYKATDASEAIDTAKKLILSVAKYIATGEF